MAKRASHKSARQDAKRRPWAKVGDQGKMDSDLLPVSPILPLSHLSFEAPLNQAPRNSIAPGTACSHCRACHLIDLLRKVVIATPIPVLVMAFIGLL
jgi:hypothetical protein